MIKRTIFLADDDEDDRMLIREAMESIVSDVEILEVVDGKELIDLLGTSTTAATSLILLDMNMPRMSGLEALAVVKSDPAHQHIPVVMLSTSSNPDLVSEAYHIGTNAYITKPVSTAEYTRIAKAVNAWFLNHYAPV